MAIKAIVNNREEEIIDVKMLSEGNELNAWEVRDQQNRLIWGKEGTISGQTPLSFKAGGVPLTGMTLYGNTVQNGTPSPTSIIMPLGVGNWDGIDLTYEIPITCGGETSTIQLSQKQTTRRIKKLVLDGTENWTILSDIYYSLPIEKPYIPDRNDLLSSHFFVGNYSGAIEIGQFRGGGTPATTIIFNYDNGVIGVEGFKQWLASEYSAGHPVTVWYALATPQIAVVNEPLMKIGDYADTITMTQAGIEIPTLQGQNTLDVGTVISPSSITINGHII